MQGLVSLYDATPSTGGLTVLPGTHLEHEAFVERLHRESCTDFVRIPKSDPFLTSKAYRPLLVTCKAGDLLLWDSRLVHCNTPAHVDTPPEWVLPAAIDGW